MKDIWKLPKAERNAIKAKVKSLKREIQSHTERINSLRPWLANVEKLKEDAELELNKTLKEYNL
jgi:prefoldin subunit 5